MQVTIHEAKTHLSRLIQRAIGGEEIVIAKGKEPLVKLVPLESLRPERQLGGMEGMIVRMADDFDAELDDFAEYMK